MGIEFLTKSRRDSIPYEVDVYVSYIKNGGGAHRKELCFSFSTNALYRAFKDSSYLCAGINKALPTRIYFAPATEQKGYKNKERSKQK